MKKYRMLILMLVFFIRSISLVQAVKEDDKKEMTLKEILNERLPTKTVSEELKNRIKEEIGL